jgi:hypothetical protein
MRWDGDKRECVGRFHVAVTATLVLLAKAMGRDGGERVALMSNLQCVERFVLHVEGQVTLHERDVGSSVEDAELGSRSELPVSYSYLIGYSAETSLF